MTAKTAERAPAKSANKVLLTSVLQYGNCTLAIPDQLSLGDDGKLYLTNSSPANRSSAKLQSVTLKESVAWFRVGHECSLKLIEGEKFDEWLRLIEQGLASAN